MTVAKKAGPIGRVPLGLKMFYGSGQAVNAITDTAINTFLLFYLTAVSGMSGSAAGAIFLISLVVDGLLDPFIGRLSDRWRSRWGRRLPFMVVALPTLMLSAYLLFALPRSLSGAGLFAYVLSLNLVFRISLSLFALPHSALNAELTEDYNERSVLSIFRALFIVAGAAAVLIPAFNVIFKGANALQIASRYPAFGITLVVLLAVFGIACIAGIAKDVARLPGPSAEETDGDVSFSAEILDLFRNPSFVYLFGGAVLVLVGQGVLSALGLHAYRYFWKIPSTLIQLPLLVLPLGMLVGTGLAGVLLKRIEKRDGVIGAVIITGLYPAIITVLALAGLITPGSQLTTGLVIFNGALVGAGGAMCFVCFYSMIADAVDEHDFRFGVRREALYAAALMIGSKAATGLGAFIAGLGLQVIGFSPPADAGAALTVSAGTITGIGVLWGPCSALLVLGALPIFYRYGIDRAYHGKVVANLAARRAGLPVGPGLNPVEF